MKKAYLGIDIGSISTKAVIVDEYDKIITSEYLYTEGNPTNAVKRLISILNKKLNKEEYKVVSVGTTGSARKLIGTILGASVVKNEITTHAVGTTSIYPDVKTILEIGGQDSKIILLNNGIVTDYAMNTLYTTGKDAFLLQQAKHLGVDIEETGATVDVVRSITSNYLNTVAKGKKIIPPIVFQGGVSKNIGVVKAFEELLGTTIYVDENSHLLGALGAAILARKSKIEEEFNFNIMNLSFETKGINCSGCPNNCEIVCIIKENKLIDSWGNRCERGTNAVNS